MPSVSVEKLPDEHQIQDVFGVVLGCLNKASSGEHLQSCAVLYRHPGLAVLAACMQVRSIRGIVIIDRQENARMGRL